MIVVTDHPGNPGAFAVQEEALVVAPGGLVRVAQAVGHREESAVLPRHPGMRPEEPLVAVRETPANADNGDRHGEKASDESHQVDSSDTRCR